MERLTEKEFTTGQMERSTTANGERESKKATACGKAYMAIATWDSGVSLKHMAMVFTNGRMETDMKAVGCTV